MYKFYFGEVILLQTDLIYLFHDKLCWYKGEAGAFIYGKNVISCEKALLQERHELFEW